MNALPVPLLTLDPSSTHIGWSLLSCGPTGPVYLNSGVYKVPEAPSDQRVVMVGAGTQWIVNQCRNTPGMPVGGFIARALVEIPDYIASYARAHSIVLYFRAVGVAEHALYEMGIPIQHERASKHKSKSRKQEAKDRFFKIVGRHPWTDDESDALTIGWDHLSVMHVALPVSTSPAPTIADDEQWDGWDGDEPEGY